MKKWLSLCAGIVLQLTLGGVYAWSAFVPALAETCRIGAGQSGLVFGVLIGSFALATIPAGRRLQRSGPRPTGALGAALLAAGFLGAGFSGGRFPLMLASFALAGVGVGHGYVCPLATGLKWFPRNKGLITGVSVAGFGGGAVLMSFLADHLLYTVRMGILPVFRFIGLAYGTAALAAAALISEPAAPSADTPAPEDTAGYRRFFRNTAFHLLCLGMFSGTFAGLMVVGNLKPMALGYGLNEKQSALSISLFALGNVIGRVAWGRIHDILHTRRTIVFSLFFLGASILLLPVPRTPAWAFLVLVTLAGTGFGACFVVYASATAELFPVALFPRLYPVCFLFYGLAALTGPPIGGWLADSRGSHAGGIVAGAALIGLSLAILHLLRHRLVPAGE